MKKYDLNAKGKEWAFGALTFAVDAGIVTAEEAVEVRQRYEL